MGLLERDSDLALLASSWDRARVRRGSMAIVKGEPGAGKSALVRAFTDSVDEVPVLWGACDPLTTPRPLGPIHDVADQLDDETRMLLRDAPLPHDIFTAVFEHLRRHPSILVIDDLHWADQGTVDLLRFLLRRIGTTGSLVIGAVRDDEVGVTHPLRSLLGDVARSPDAMATALRPLSTEAIAQLIEDRPVDPDWLRRVTGGNPFFVVEMLDHDTNELPSTVRDAILARTTDLDADAWHVLHLLACSPEAIPDQLLARLEIGLPPLRALDDAGLIRRDRRAVAFRHDLCRTAIEGTLPPGGEVAFHQQMLEALEASARADPAVLVHHAVGAGDAPRILQHASAAGRAAARSGAHTQAAAFFRIALDQGAPTAATDEAALLELLADEHYLTDQLDDAIAASERALRLRERANDAAGMSNNHHALSTYHWYNADRAVAEHHASAAVAVLDNGADDRSDIERIHLGHAFAMQAYLELQASETECARALIDRAEQAGGPVNDPTLSVRIGLLRAIADVIEGERTARTMTLRLLGSPEEHFSEVYSSGYSNLTYLDVEQRRFEHATDLLGVSLPMTVERDLPICRVWQLGSRGRLRLLEGDWNDALADAEWVLSDPSAPLARTWPHLVRGLVTLRRGGDAEADLDEAWRLACRLAEPFRILPAAAALVERAWLTGQPDARLDECRSLLSRPPQVGLEWARGELASWLHRLDRTADADGIAEPFRLQLDGDFEGAADAWEKLTAPYERALALVDTGDPDHARVGVDLLDRLGADAVAAKVRQDLRSQGVTAVPARRRPTTLANANGLTSRQVEVLRLLGDGLTNAELAEQLFIAPKTADHHVSAILSKLQVTSRRDAVRRARELQIID